LQFRHPAFHLFLLLPLPVQFLFQAKHFVVEVDVSGNGFFFQRLPLFGGIVCQPDVPEGVSDNGWSIHCLVFLMIKYVSFSLAVATARGCYPARCRWSPDAWRYKRRGTHTSACSPALR